jgi:hypothetical protein
VGAGAWAPLPALPVFDPRDLIAKIDDVLGGDNFDGDGQSNAAEIDPTDPDSFPGQLITVDKGDVDPMEFTSVSRTFILTRTGDLSALLEVFYSLGGAAMSRIDYLEPTGVGTVSFGVCQEDLSVRVAGKVPECERG